MKKLILVITLFSFFLVPLSASSKSKSKGAVWLTDYNKALKLSRKTQKPILLNFTGSDWCGYCIKLKKEVFSQKAFIDYASENLILVDVDFPRKKKLPSKTKKQNKQLQKNFKITGYPTVYLVDGKGKTIGKTGYFPGGPEKYIENLKRILK